MIDSDEEVQENDNNKEPSYEDFGAIDVSSDDEEPDIPNNDPPQRSPNKRIPATIPNPIPIPNYEPSCGTSTREAKDIDHFFVRGNKKSSLPTICIFCRWVF